MTQIPLPGDNRAVDGNGFWLRPWHALLDLLTRRLATAETNIETLTASIADLSNAPAPDSGGNNGGGGEVPAVPDDPNLPGISTNWNILLKESTTLKIIGETFADDTALQFPMLAGRTYVFRAHVFIGLSGTGCESGYGINAPANTDFFRYQIASVTNTYPREETVAVSPGVGQVKTVSAIFNFGMVEINGIVINGPNGGVLSFAWGPTTGIEGSRRVYRGSYMEYMVMPEEDVPV